MLLKSSYVLLDGNEITNNQCIGIYVRDKSKGKFQNNKVKNFNPYFSFYSEALELIIIIC